MTGDALGLQSMTNLILIGQFDIDWVSKMPWVSSCQQQRGGHFFFQPSYFFSWFKKQSTFVFFFKKIVGTLFFVNKVP